MSSRRRQLKATWRRILFRNVSSFAAIIGMIALAAYTTIYILDHQRLRLPLLDEKGFELKAEFTTAQAVIPGQGQTVRVSGIRIGDITGVELHDGLAVVRMDVDERYRKLVHADATALLRPKTGLKDMFIELDPGREGAPIKPGFTIPVANTRPDVNTDEVLAMLDADTRDYLKLLLHGLGEGLHKRGDDFGEVMRRLEPTHRDLKRVAGAVAERERNLRRVTDHLAKLNGALADKDGELTRLVAQSAIVFREFASEERNISRSVGAFPAALRETTKTLGKVRRFADILRPAAGELRPAVRALNSANKVVAPSALAVTPVVRDEIRPFARAARPLVADLRAPSRKIADANPDLTRVGVEFNKIFNIVSYNPNGREDPGKADREEGYLFWIAWLAHQGVNIFSSSDAHGTFRPIAVSTACNTLRSYLDRFPEQEFLQNFTPILTSSGACG